MKDTDSGANPTIPPDDLARDLTLVGPNEDRNLKHVALAGDIYTSTYATELL